ncbi:uncharacterized protein [Antennarius striatus]|uniref:uncharacterized protein n=1 Tax=Antennarius striatus TaxID=241820 RepID=UPI0035B46665
MQTHISEPEPERTRPTPGRRSMNSLWPQCMSDMTGLAALCLLLVFPLSCSQSTLQSEQKVSTHQVPAAAPPPAPHPSPPPPQLRNLLRKEEDTNLNTKQTYGKDDAKVGMFIAASIGTVALMAAVYCIYNKFYTKQQYLHTQLDDDSDLTTDPMDPPPMFFHTSADSSTADVRRAGYGSVSSTASIISVPPSLSPPPSAMPFPPPFLSSHSLRTISAKDLEKSCI